MFTFKRVGDLELAELVGESYQAKYIRIGDVYKFIFNGKTPSRREIRVMIKDWSYHKKD